MPATSIGSSRIRCRWCVAIGLALACGPALPARVPAATCEGAVQAELGVAWPGPALRMEPAAARSGAAAALLASFLQSGAAGDLVEAGEILAHGGDRAARCNRLVVLERLGLHYRKAQEAAACPC